MLLATFAFRPFRRHGCCLKVGNNGTKQHSKIHLRCVLLQGKGFCNGNQHVNNTETAAAPMECYIHLFDADMIQQWHCTAIACQEAS